MKKQKKVKGEKYGFEDSSEAIMIVILILIFFIIILFPIIMTIRNI